MIRSPISSNAVLIILALGFGASRMVEVVFDSGGIKPFSRFGWHNEMLGQAAVVGCLGGLLLVARFRKPRSPEFELSLALLLGLTSSVTYLRYFDYWLAILALAAFWEGVLQSISIERRARRFWPNASRFLSVLFLITWCTLLAASFILVGA